jgi:peptidoglycan/LPS O-acetylase OafA/YrhL
MNPKHFAGLDGLRFISIAFVVLHHLFTFKTNFGFTGFDYPVLWLIGFYGIQFFFMGSGFLITYLLLYEYQSFGKISLKNFFLRRIMRIWPAYYLLILLFLLVLKQSFFRLPGTTETYLVSNYQQSNAFYLFFLPHLQPFFFPTAPYVHHTYTIGIEEQFYILWGLLFYFFRRYMHRLFLVLLIVVPLLNFAHEMSYTYVQQHANASRVLRLFNTAATYIQYSRFSTFAIGSLFGYAYFHKQTWIYVFKRWWVQLLVYAGLFFSIFFRLDLAFVQYEYISLLMACVMLIATFKQESLINYSAGWISYLGKISYGIYLYHIFAIVFACKLVGLFTTRETSLAVTFALCLLALGMSILFGEISYRYFERYFLRLKEKFRQSAKNRRQASVPAKESISNGK